MTYDEARAFLAGLVNYEQQSPSATDLALEPIRDLLGELGDPHRRLAVVHVAGTNGKGSFAVILDEILRQAGYRTGRYTTPALRSFEDQICVGGVPISTSACTDHLTVIRDVVTSDAFRHAARRSPTYFDVVTAMAFRHFASAPVDVAVVEVGLGGRNDSTNVCSPVLSVITSIGHDHTSQLGRDLRSIAREKAGIIKPGRPCVSGAVPEEAREVIRSACAERGSPLWQLGVDVAYEHAAGRLSGEDLTPARVTVTTPRGRWPAMDLNLLGEHQAANAALALAAVEVLRDSGFDIPARGVARALSQVRCPGRTEVLTRRPLVVLDCSHNPAATGALVATLTQSFPDHLGPVRKHGAKRYLVFGASRDKDLAALLRILSGHFDHIIFTRCERSRRAATRQELEAALRAGGSDRPHRYVDGVSEAFRVATSEATGADLVCVTGSVFLAGEFLDSVEAE